MTKLGVLGLGARSTEYYFHRLNKLYNLKNGGYSTFPMMLLNTDFNRINNLLPEPNEALLHNINQYLKEFKKLKVEKVLIPNITLHESLDILIVKKECNLKFIHPLQLCISELKQKGIKEVLVLATPYTTYSPNFENTFKNNGIELKRPSESELIFIDDLRKQVYASLEQKEDLLKYNSIVNKYRNETPTLIACTELSIVTELNLSNVFDLAEMQIQEALAL